MKTLIDKIKKLTLKIQILFRKKIESVFLFRGYVPQENFMISLILDFGGISIKGGYVEDAKGNNIIF